MMPTMIVSMMLLQFFAKADIKPAGEEERRDDADENEIVHEVNLLLKSRIG
jgi:hypothetical protein